MPRTPIRDLNHWAIDAQSRKMDWSEGWTETWDVVYPNGWDVKGDDEHETDELIPMMNYFYPLPGFLYRWEGSEGEAALLIQKNVPLTIVLLSNENKNDRYGFALTGGGMDLTWEICEAYMLLGYLPPLTFAARLPRMAQRLTLNRRWVIAGCLATAEHVANRAKQDIEQLKALRAWYVAREKKEKSV